MAESERDDELSRGLARLVQLTRTDHFDRAAAIRAISEADPDALMDRPLPASEADYIAEHGGIDVRSADAEWPAAYAELVVSTAASFAQQLLTTRQIAERLNMSSAGVRRRRTANGLLAYTIGGSLLFPEWQLHQTETGEWKPIPYLSEVIGAIRPDAHPFSVSATMTTPQRELIAEQEVEQTPAQWLVQGRSKVPVLAMLRQELAW